MTMTTTTNEREISDLTTKIANLLATPRALIGSDGGTHGQPDEHRIYEEISGERYATYSFANANATRCTVEQAQADTHGQLRWFNGEIERMAGLRAELTRAQIRLANLTVR